MSFSVGESVLTVLEKGEIKTVVQVVNEEWNGGEVEVGKRISKINGEADVNCSMRGLNSLVENKNKLIIFD